MGTTAFALVISGALLHALWNLAAKRAAGGVVFVWLYDLSSLVVLLPFACATYLADPGQFNRPALMAITGSTVVHIAYALALQRAYQLSEFSIVYPVARGTGPLFAVFGAVMVLGEMPSLLGWGGIASVLCGLLLLSWPQGASGMSASRVNGLKWGCITGLCIALYTVVDGWAVKRTGIAPELYFFSGTVLRAILLMPQALRHSGAVVTQWRQHHREVLCVGILSPLAYVLVLYAVRIAPLSYVAPLREMSMLIAMFLGVRWLKEAFSIPRLCGTLGMFLGVILIACG